MKDYVVYNDVHVGGGHELGDAIPSVASDNLILNGDIVDLTGCAKKDVKKHLRYYEMLTAIHGRRMLKGNHEGSVFGNICFIDGGVLFTHGHNEMWKKSKVIKWENKKMGSGWFKRKVLVPAFDKLRHFRKYKIKKRFKKNILHLSAMHPMVHTMVFGHAHPNKIIDTTIHGIRIMVLPRGRNEINA